MRKRRKYQEGGESKYVQPKNILNPKAPKQYPVYKQPRDPNAFYRNASPGSINEDYTIESFLLPSPALKGVGQLYKGTKVGLKRLAKEGLEDEAKLASEYATKVQSRANIAAKRDGRLLNKQRVLGQADFEDLTNDARHFYSEHGIELPPAEFDAIKHLNPHVNKAAARQALKAADAGDDVFGGLHGKATLRDARRAGLSDDEINQMRAGRLKPYTNPAKPIVGFYGANRHGGKVSYGDGGMFNPGQVPQGYFLNPGAYDYRTKPKVYQPPIPTKEERLANVGRNAAKGTVDQDYTLESILLPMPPVGKALGKIAKIGKGKKALPTSTPFKSEIDWAKWNPETPKHKVLMDEYNAIEESTKKAGTWMKNPDGSPFQGTPEQFIQQQSSWFKKAFPEGFENVFRGVRDKNVVKELNPERSMFTADFDLASNYTRNNEISTPFDQFNTLDKSQFNPNVKEGMFNLAHKKSPKSVELDNFGKEWTSIDLTNPKQSVSNIELNIKHLEKQLERQKEFLKSGKQNPDGSWSFPDTDIVYSNQLYREGTTGQEKIINSYKDRLKNINNLVKNEKELEKMKSVLGDKTTTDDIAKYIEDSNLDYVKIKNVDDSGLGDVSIVNHKKGNYLKSLVGNVGFFDMSDPNIYKSLVPAAISTAALGITQQKKEGGRVTYKEGGEVEPYYISDPKEFKRANKAYKDSLDAYHVGLANALPQLKHVGSDSSNITKDREFFHNTYSRKYAELAYPNLTKLNRKIDPIGYYNAGEMSHYLPAYKKPVRKPVYIPIEEPRRDTVFVPSNEPRVSATSPNDTILELGRSTVGKDGKRLYRKGTQDISEQEFNQLLQTYPKSRVKEYGFGGTIGSILKGGAGALNLIPGVGMAVAPITAMAGDALTQIDNKEKINVKSLISSGLSAFNPLGIKKRQGGTIRPTKGGMFINEGFGIEHALGNLHEDGGIVYNNRTEVENNEKILDGNYVLTDQPYSEPYMKESISRRFDKNSKAISDRNNPEITESAMSFLKDEAIAKNEEYLESLESMTNRYAKGGWIQKATDSIERRGTEGKCTPITKPGCTGRARALALTFKKMAKNRHQDGGSIRKLGTQEGRVVTNRFVNGGLTETDLLNQEEARKMAALKQSLLNQNSLPTSQRQYYIDPTQEAYNPTWMGDMYNTTRNHDIAVQRANDISNDPNYAGYGQGSKGIPYKYPSPKPQTQKQFPWEDTLYGVASLAPAIYNMGAGLFGKTQQYNPENYITRGRLNYKPISGEEIKRQINSQRAATDYQLRDAGITSRRSRLNNSYNAMQTMAQAQERIDNINTQGQLETDRFNLGLDQDNNRIRLTVADINDRNKAARQQMLAQGLSDVSEFAQGTKRDKIMKSMLTKMYGRRGGRIAW